MYIRSPAFVVANASCRRRYTPLYYRYTMFYIETHARRARVIPSLLLHRWEGLEVRRTTRLHANFWPLNLAGTGEISPGPNVSKRRPRPLSREIRFSDVIKRVGRKDWTVCFTRWHQQPVCNNIKHDGRNGGWNYSSGRDVNCIPLVVDVPSTDNLYCFKSVFKILIYNNRLRCRPFRPSDPFIVTGVRKIA